MWPTKYTDQGQRLLLCLHVGFSSCCVITFNVWVFLLTLLLVSCGPPRPVMNCGLHEEFQTQNPFSFLFSLPKIQKHTHTTFQSIILTGTILFCLHRLLTEALGFVSSSSSLIAGHEGLSKLQVCGESSLTIKTSARCK